MRKLKNRKGFTLVELLIVVAIIGVLSTIGIPAFRRMVQKSRQSEAKVNLAALYTAEQGFFSEYSSFGNNLNGLGFSIDGANTIYAVGFTAADCSTSETNVIPTFAGNGAIHNNICSSNPSYFLNAACASAEVAVGGNYVAGRAVVAGTHVCLNVTAGTLADGSAFLASATGAIAPGVLNTTALAVPGTPGQDAWTMNQQKILAHTNDGVN